MADKKISELTELTTPDGTEELVVNDSGVSKKVQIDNLIADNGLSGNKIDGGTISNFRSTGIDDNATSTAITIDSGENVGIGTSSPLAKTNIVSAGAALGGTSHLALGSSTTNYENTYLRIDNSGNSNFCIDQIVGGVSYNRMFIERTTGNVGIGTTTPEKELHVYQGGGAATYVKVENPAGFAYYGVSGDGSPVWYGPSGKDNLIYTNGTEKLRIQAGGGISFNGDTAAANALDDYEEGTWTPVLGADSTDPSVTYNTHSGTYTKIGNQVTVQFNINCTPSGGSGAVVIKGLPFTSSSTSAAYIGSFEGKYMSYTSGYTTAYISLFSSSNKVYLRQNGSNKAEEGIDITLISSSLAWYRGTITYFV